MSNQEARSALHAAASYLSARCDYAHSQDGMGYSQADTSLGHGLAAIPPESWSDDLVKLASSILHKYRRQLGEGGFTLPVIPDAESHSYAAEDRARAEGRKALIEKSKSIDYDSGVFKIRFRYDPHLVDAVRRVPGRRFVNDGGDKYNTVPLTSATSLAKFAEDYSFALTEEAQNAIHGSPPETEAAPEMEASSEKIVWEDPYYEVSFEPGTNNFHSYLGFVKNLPGRAFDPDRKVWLVQRTNGPTLVAWALKQGFDVSDKALEIATSDARRQATLKEGSTATTADLELENFGSGDLSPYPFQLAGVKYALDALPDGGVIVGDEMGLGKTVQALGVAQHQLAFPLLVVCPANLKLNWEKEIKQWLPGRTVSVLSGRKPSVPRIQADVVVINYDILGGVEGRGSKEQVTGWLPILAERGFKLLVCDEAHYIKNPKTKRTKGLVWLARRLPENLLLTGTPVVNRPEELYPLLRVMGREKQFGGYKGFFRNYVWAPSPDLKELNERLRRTCFVRRRKAEVLKELPPKQRQVVPVELSNLEEYRKAERDFIAWLEEQGAGPFELAAAERGQQLARLNGLRKLVGEGKIASAIKWIDEFLTSGEKLIVFAHHKLAQERIYEAFSNVAVRLVGGGESVRRSNEEAKERFQNDPNVRLIVVSLMAGQEGHTLTAASHVAHIQLGWTPKDMRQSEDRAHRIGQDAEMVNVYWLLSSVETVDQDMANIILEKMKIVDATADGEEGNQEQDSIAAEVASSVLKRAHVEV